MKVSRRDGINYVFNGQHTIEIVALVSDSWDTPVWCMIYDDSDYMQEADIFANQIKYVKRLLPYKIFMNTIENIYDKYGFHTLDHVLRLCIATWEGDVDSFSANILNGIARLTSAYSGALKGDAFKERVGKCSLRRSLAEKALRSGHLPGRNAFFVGKFVDLSKF